MPITTLFGVHGTKVRAMIDAAGEFTLERATQLSGARHPQAGQAYTRVWHSWLARERPDFLQANRELRQIRGVAPCSKRPIWAPGAELDGTLNAGPLSASPVAQGLGLVSGEAARRAEALIGKSVWSDDPDDPEGALLAEPWPLAIRALLDAALAFGAPEFVSEADRAILLKAWREVIGAEPG
jgi:hypothetical protein